MAGCFQTLLQRVPRHNMTAWRVALHHPGLRRPGFCPQDSPRRLLYLSPRQTTGTGPAHITSLLSDDRQHWSSPPQRHLRTSPVLPAKPDSTLARLKQMIKDYWYVIIPVEIVTSIGWYGAIFISLRSGVDIVEILTNIGVSQQTIE